MSNSTQRINNHDQVIELDFHGPHSFHAGDNYLFNSDFVSCEGVYVWALRNEVDGANYVHYIGETTSFGRRHREHLLQMTGLNYRILDADHARSGVEKVVWNGMWRDRSPQAAASLLDSYDEASKKVIDYIRLIRVFFAQTKVDRNTRTHIEACLANALRAKGPDANRFYPSDNRVRAVSNEQGCKLVVKTPEVIVGISRD